MTKEELKQNPRVTIWTEPLFSFDEARVEVTVIDVPEYGAVKGLVHKSDDPGYKRGDYIWFAPFVAEPRL